MEGVSRAGEPQRARRTPARRRLACVTALLAAAAASSLVSTASAASASRQVQYRGYRIAVPAGWPVYDLSTHPAVCVRFNRHAVYLGRPSAAQHCPAHAVGRTEAILLEPLTAGAASATRANPGAAVTGGSVARLALPAHGVMVTATWAGSPRTIERALGRRSLPPGPAIKAGSAAEPRSATASRSSSRPPVAKSAAVYTGLGFDACSAPSPSTMTAWGVSPYHAVGIYLGGANSACAQPNLTSAWVEQESAAGWNLIPTYVGLQASSNGCGCQAIKPARASAEGTAAAQDAIAQAQALGIGPGSPIYDDMEAFTLGPSDDSAVLAYLSAWTSALHAGGYVSGVYSSANSGIRLLVAQVGTAFVEPDDIWVASWNGQQSTTDPNVPSTDWASHQRLHQYLGGHNATYGGVKLSIDSDYLDGATASDALTPTPVPTATVSPMANGSVQIRAAWIGEPGVASWQFYGGDDPATLTPLRAASAGGGGTILTIHSQLAYFAVQALGSSGQLLGTSAALPTPAHLAIYGRSVFVPGHGLAGLPVGCFTGGPCQLTTTLSIGSAVLATTGPESIPADGGGVVYFKLTPAGRARLAAAGNGRLLVRVTERDSSGTTATATLNLIPFVTHGRAPRRSLTDSPGLRLVGATDFVSRNSVGGILAGCSADTPCPVSTKLTVAGHTIASAGQEDLGAHELGYLIFTLNGRGRALLAKAKGNQLGVTVTISGAGAEASGHVVLINYS